MIDQSAFLPANVPALPWSYRPLTPRAPLGARLRRLRHLREVPMSASARAFHDATARPVTPKVQEFLADLIETFGDERVAQAILDDAGRSEPGRILGVVRDRLAKTDAAERRRLAPLVELTGEALMAVVRGQTAPPPHPYTFDARGLTQDEYGEVVGWRVKHLEEAAR